MIQVAMPAASYGATTPEAGTLRGGSGMITLEMNYHAHDGRRVVVLVNLDDIAVMAQRALRSKSGRSQAGPACARVIARPAQS